MSAKVSSFTPEFVAELRQEMLKESRAGQVLHSRSVAVSNENARYVRDFRISRDEINEAYAKARSK